MTLCCAAAQNDVQSQTRLHAFAACADRGPDRPVRRPRKHDVHASAFHVVSLMQDDTVFTAAAQNDAQSQARLHAFAACADAGPRQTRPPTPQT